MTDLFMGTPPPVAALVRFDADWHGQRHRNICVHLVDGKAVIKPVGDEFKPYYAPKATTYFEWTPGVLTITTPDDPHFDGTACVGVSE